MFPSIFLFPSTITGIWEKSSVVKKDSPILFGPKERPWLQLFSPGALGGFSHIDG